MAAHNDQVGLLLFGDAVDLTFGSPENKVLPGGINVQTCRKLAQVGFRLLLNLFLHRRQIHGHVAAVRQAQRFDHMHDMHLGTKTAGERDGAICNSIRFLGEVDGQHYSRIVAHVVLPACWRDDTTVDNVPQEEERNLVWLIIVFVVALIVGPVMYLKPTARDKRLTVLRMRARTLGLTVELTHLPQLNPRADERVSAAGRVLRPEFACTAYRLPLQVENFSADVRWQRIPPDASVPVNVWRPGWHLAPPEGPREPADNRRLLEAPGAALLAEQLLQLPDQWLAVGVDARFVSCFWREDAVADSTAVEEIHNALQGLRGVILGLASRPNEG